MRTDEMKQFAQKMIDYYNAGRRQDEFEPKWILPPFDLAFAGDLKSLRRDWPRKEMRAEFCDDRAIFVRDFPPFGTRIVQGGFKVGTVSWIFLGRRDSPIERVGDWVACRRRIPEEVKRLGRESGFPDVDELWALYSMDDPGVILDRGPGSYEDIMEMAANPSYYGVPVSEQGTVQTIASGPKTAEQFEAEGKKFEPQLHFTFGEADKELVDTLVAPYWKCVVAYHYYSPLLRCFSLELQFDDAHRDEMFELRTRYMEVPDTLNANARRKLLSQIKAENGQKESGGKLNKRRDLWVP